ncbi:MAG: hypothetical protein M1825_002861 [Sarcosagium campestre]|nr:MAG: hypothetical protein M1825_002861 [Sarcosagium campestre]
MAEASKPTKRPIGKIGGRSKLTKPPAEPSDEQKPVLEKLPDPAKKNTNEAGSEGKSGPSSGPSVEAAVQSDAGPDEDQIKADQRREQLHEKLQGGKASKRAKRRF